MGKAYTPGLTVSGDTIVEKVRRLPIKGEVLVKEGDTVKYDTVVAQALLDGLLQTIRLADKLGVEAKEAPGFFRFQVGDQVNEGDVIAETKGFMGFFKSIVHSDYTGTVESISEITGGVFIREAPIPVDIKAYINGTIKTVIPEEGVIVETRGGMVQGIFGVGGERSGTIRVAVASADEVLQASHIKDDDAGKILIGGSGVTAEALTGAGDKGVAGLIVGAIKDSDLIEYLGYDIGVAITGQEDIPVTVMATEGFGQLSMAERTFNLLKSLEGRHASMNGATQIRAGVIRPEIIAPIEHAAGDAIPEHSGNALEIGVPIRVIREPYFGALGTVTGLPSQLLTVESGAEVRVLKAKLDDGRDVTVPRANVEIIAAS